MTVTTFNDLVAAELRAFRGRRPGPEPIASGFEAFTNIAIHLDRVMRHGPMGGDSEALLASLVDLAAEARRSAEDLGLELGGRFGEMAAIAYEKASPRTHRPVASAAELWGLLQASHTLLQWANLDDSTGAGRPDAARILASLDPGVVRPLDCLLYLYVAARKGAEDLGLVARPQAA